ncbi:MAG: EAL domain-containing protein, partial [Pseudomonadota bacterium]
DYDSGARLRAVVFAAVDLTWLNPLVQQTRLPEGLTLTLLDSRGIILNRYPYPEKWIGISRADSKLFRAIRETRGEGTAEDVGLDGVRRIYAFAPLRHSSSDIDVFIAIGIPRHVVYAGVERTLILVGTGLTIVTVLVLLAAWYGGDIFLLRRLTALVSAAQRLARGEAGARSGIRDGGREIVQLAHAFDDMAETIERRDTDLRHSALILKESEERFRTLVETTSDWIWEVDAHGVYTYASPKVKELLGYLPEEIIGKTSFDFMPPDEAARVGQQYAEIVAAQRPFERLENINLHKDGRRVMIETSGVPIFDREGRFAGYRGMDRDVTERIKAQEKLHYLAYYDELTGLPNRALLLDRLKQTLIEAQRHQRVVAVLYMDINHFKNINDTLGMETGNRLIRMVAERLQGCVRPGDTVARMGGDEFCIVLADLAQESDVAEIIQKILVSFSAPHRLAERELSLSVTIGISLFPRDATEPETLLKNADIAMYRAKEHDDGYQYYSPDMTASATERLTLENDLRHALEQHELFLHYQPQVNLRTGAITGVEALLRWRHPKLGMVSPAKFIPLAEDTHLILPIGEWVLREACAQARAWQDAGLPPLRMGVNLSARQFRQPDLAGTVRRILDETGLDPNRLDIELTESTLVQSPEAVAEILSGLEMLGIQISIDDFGTGYSSLTYLKRLPIDILKIDQSFMHSVTTDPDDASIVIAIITLAHALGIQTIAEGVETKEQLEFLRKHGCEAMQGYYFSKPLPAENVAVLLRENRCLEPAKA